MHGQVGGGDKKLFRVYCLFVVLLWQLVFRFVFIRRQGVVNWFIFVSSSHLHPILPVASGVYSFFFFSFISCFYFVLSFSSLPF